jgi:hypothetical protein
MSQFPIVPYMDPVAANRRIAEEGVADLRFLPAGFFRSRRTGQEPTQHEQAVEADRQATTPTETAASALRVRLATALRSPQARGKTDAALALALRTDMSTDQIAATLRDLPAECDLGLPPRAITDPDAKAEADRIRQIVTADAAQGHTDHALALAFDTDTPVAAALAILGAMPKPQQIASIEERAAELDEFGPSDLEMESLGRGGRVDAAWSKAVAAANQQFEKGQTDV